MKPTFVQRHLKQSDSGCIAWNAIVGKSSSFCSIAFVLAFKRPKQTCYLRKFKENQKEIALPDPINSFLGLLTWMQCKRAAPFRLKLMKLATTPSFINPSIVHTNVGPLYRRTHTTSPFFRAGSEPLIHRAVPVRIPRDLCISVHLFFIENARLAWALVCVFFEYIQEGNLRMK